MKKINVKTTRESEVVNITKRIEELLPDEDSGLVTVFLKHTSACITTADLDPGTGKDLLDALNNMMPDLDYRHPHDPSHVTDHLISSIVGPSVTIPFKNSKLLLGEWQEVVLVELNGPRERNLLVNVLE